MKLLIESADTEQLTYITEAKEEGKEKQYYIRGPFMQAEAKNKNSRIYRKDVLKREIQRYNEEFIKENRSLGRIDHPVSNATVLLREAGLIVTKLDFNDDDNIGYGEARLLNTPDGKIAKVLIDEGVKLAVSTRGLGSLNESGIVGEDYKLIAVDLVSNPSCALSVVESIVESKDYIIDGSGNLVEIAISNLEKDLSKHGSKQLAEDLSKFISNLRKRI